MNAPNPLSAFERRVGSVRMIQRRVAEAFGIPVEEMWSERRARRIARPRQVAMVLAYDLTGRSTPTIGHCFNRDHTTVMHAIKKIETLVRVDAVLAQQVEDLRERLDIETNIVRALSEAAEDLLAAHEKRLFNLIEKVRARIAEDPEGFLEKMAEL